MRSWGRGQWLIASGIVLGILTVIAAATENTFAAALLQGAALVLSIGGSWVLGQEAAATSAQAAAQDVVRPHAKSAFRRTRTLWKALGTINTVTAGELSRLEALKDEDGNINFEYVRGTLLSVEAVVNAHLPTADDALDDWRDLVPEDVAQIEREAKERAGGISD